MPKKFKTKKTQYEELVSLLSEMDTEECFGFDPPKDRIAGGYSRIKVSGVRILTHRVSYSVANSITFEDMAGLVVRHSCDNPICVNPRHLSLGTQKDNVDDMMARGRMVKAHPGFGENHHSSKLTIEQIEEARRLYVKGNRWNRGVSYAELAKRYGVSPHALRSAMQGKTYKFVCA
jgi:hypothetical protein